MTGKGVDIVTPMAPIYDDYSGTLSIILGVIGIILGIMTVVWDIVAISFSNTYATGIGYGLWSGVIFIVTGCFGIAAGQNSVHWRVITFMSLSIVSAICGCVTFCLGVVDSVTTNTGRFSMACQHEGNLCVYKNVPGSNGIQVTVAMTALLAAMGFLEGIVAIIGSTLGCKVACCGRNANAQVVQYNMQRA